MNTSLSHPEQVLALARVASTDAEMLALAEQLRLLAAADVRTVLETADLLVTRSGPASRAHVRALAARANALCYANDFDAALADLECACRQCNGALEDELPLLLLGRIQPLARLGRLREAEDSARQSGVLFRRRGSLSMAAKAEANLGIVLRMLGRPGEALDHFRSALSSLGDDPPSVAALQSNLAEALLELDRFAEASSAYEEARRILCGSAHVHAAAIVEGNLAELYGRMGRVDESLSTFVRAREWYAQAGARGDTARLTAEEAEILVSAGAVRRGIRLFERAIPTLEEAGMAREAARALMSLGAALLRRGSVRRAVDTIDRALRAAESAGAEALCGEAALVMGEASLASGSSEKAIALSHVASSRGAHSPSHLARAALLRSAAYLAMNETESAWAAADEAGTLLGDHPLAPLRSRLAHARGLVRAAQGRSEEAAWYLREAVRAAESFRGSIRAEHLRLSAHEASQDLFVHAVEAVLDSGAPGALDEAFEVTERQRARSLLERCAGSLHGGGRSSSGAESADLRASLERLNALYSRFGAAGGAAGDTPVSRARVHDAEAEYERLLDRCSAGSELSSGWCEPCTLGAALGALPDGVAVASVFRDGSCASVLVLSGGEVSLSRRVMTLSELGSRCRRLEMLVERSLAGIDPRADGEWEESLVGLRETLLGPARSEIDGASRLVLIPFGALHRVPLHVGAVLEDRGGRVETYSPSVSVGLSLCSSDASRAEVVSVGVADDSAPLMEREAEEVASCWAGSVALTGSRASADRVLGALASADVVHLSCHCVFDDEFPLSTRVMLSDRWVTARELCGVMKRGAFVVLAGCESGREATGAGDEQLGLKHAVIGAGASGVVSVPWQVHDSTALEMFVSMHRRIAGLDGPILVRAASAIAHEQRRMRRLGLPFHTWAGLSVTGAIR